MVRNNEHVFDLMNLTPLALKVLVFLSRSPNEEFYIRDLAKKIHCSVGGCHKVLSNMYKMGLVTRRRSGKNLYYKANEKDPALKHLKIFVSVQELHSLISEISPTSRKIILFGSCATGEDTMKSDIDILAITEKEKKVKANLKGRMINTRKINAIVLSPHRYLIIKEKDPVFHDEVSKGLTLWRVEDERI